MRVASVVIGIMLASPFAWAGELVVRKVKVEHITAPDRNPARAWEANAFTSTLIELPIGYATIEGAEVFGQPEGCK